MDSGIIIEPMAHSNKGYEMKKGWKILIIAILVLVGIRLALPSIATNQINKALDETEGYHGSVADVDFALYRGGVKMQNLIIIEEASEDTTLPFVDLRSLDFSIDWGALFKGKLVAEIYLDTLKINLTVRDDAKIEETDSTDQRLTLAQNLQELNPMQINVIQIKNGEISYKDPTSSPAVDISMNHLFFEGKNIGNVVDKDNILPASMHLDADAMGDGSIVMDVDLNILKDIPDFDYNLKVEHVDLPLFNDFMKAYGKFDVEKGRLNLYSEAKARNGQIEGYIKPVIEELEITTKEEDIKLPQKIYEGTIEVVSKILENDKKERVATKVAISGSMENTHTNTMQAILNLLGNAFIEAYNKELDYSINEGKGN